MKTGIAMAAIASLLLGAADRLWAQLPPHEADTWTTPAYGEGGAIASTAYGESGLWTTPAFSGVDAGALKGGLGGGSTGAAAGPAFRPGSGFGETPIFAAPRPQKAATAAKAGTKPTLTSTNAPGIAQPIGGPTNAVPRIVPTQGTPTSRPEPDTSTKAPSSDESGETRQP